MKKEENQNLRDSEAYKPIGGLYDDKREHGSAYTQHCDEGTIERDKYPQNSSTTPTENAAGSAVRSESSTGDEAAGVGNQ